MKLDTDTMTATERVKASLLRQEPDRAPCYVMGIPNYSKCYKEFIKREGNGELDDFFDNDDNLLLTPMGDFTLKYFFGADMEMTSVGMHFPPFLNLLVNPNGSLNPDPAALGSLPPGNEATYVSYYGSIHGIKVLDTGEPYTWYLDGYLKKKEDAIAWYDKYGWPSECEADKANVSSYEEFQAKSSDRFCLIPQIAGCQLYESTWPIMGQARWGYYCRKDPDYIQRLVNDRKECQLKMLDELARYKPFAVFGGDDLGQKGRSLLSPGMFRKFFKQPYSEIFQKIHDMGAIAFNHSCGNMTELLPDYIEAGLDGWQSLEPASLIDHAALKKKYGDRFVFVGGIDSREISFGTPESIRKHVRAQLLNMGIGGGYVPGPTHDFLTETPLDNCLAMRDAIQQEGHYPLE
jgi:hypothetical protein